MFSLNKILCGSELQYHKKNNGDSYNDGRNRKGYKCCKERCCNEKSSDISSQKNEKKIKKNENEKTIKKNEKKNENEIKNEKTNKKPHTLQYNHPTPHKLLLLLLLLSTKAQPQPSVLPTYTYNPQQGSLPPITAPNPQNGCYLTKTDNGLVQVCPSNIPTGGKEVVATYSVPNQVNKKTYYMGNKPSLESLERLDPMLAKKIQSIFKYSGIQQPWDRIKDFYDDKQRMMPDPCMLYTEMRDILRVFESLKELISNELRKIQVYVERAKMYLKEDHVKLKDLLSRMSLTLVKMKSTKDKKNQNDYANLFNKLNAETQEEVKRYNQTKEWMFLVLKYFKRLF